MLPAVISHAPAVAPQPEPFDLHEVQVFTSIPEGHGLGIASVHGVVVIYDEAPIHREGFVEGAFYVRESQRTRGCMPWQQWLELEVKEGLNVGPLVQLVTRREVVRAVRWPNSEHWALRLASGFTDGPLREWTFGHDLIGKVVGIYRPTIPN